jgi:hypothetical protein
VQIGGHFGSASPGAEKFWRTAVKLRIFDYQNLSQCGVAAPELAAKALKIYARLAGASKKIDQHN